MSGNIKGTIIDVDGKMHVRIDKENIPDRCEQTEFKMINVPDGILNIGDVIECDLISMGEYTYKYKVYVLRNTKNSVKYTDFMNMVDRVVLHHMNEEEILFGKWKDTVLIEDLFTKCRRREVVVCRNIAINMIYEFVGRQINLESIASHYKGAILRSNIYHSLKKMADYRVDEYLWKTIDNIKEEVELIYNNLKGEN